MNEDSDFKPTEVAVIKGDTPKGTVINGIETLGGISKFINEGDQVFIKFNLCIPTGFPAISNFNVLEALITICKKAGATKIRLGSYPSKSISCSTISEILNLDEYFRVLGAEFVYLDNSDFFTDKKIKREQLYKIKEESFSKVMVNEKEFLFPKVILNSDKLIILNQVNVNPIFKLNLSLLNSYSMVSPRYQEIKNNGDIDTTYLLRDQFKQDLISDILDVFTIKQPNLVINDFFYLLESAGPFIYRDSNLRNPSIMVLGTNAVSVDLITLKLLNIDIQSSKLLLEAYQKGLGPIEPKKIILSGEEIEDVGVFIELCSSKLEEIHLKNIKINSGQLCSGCFKQAYHLLNIMKTQLVKDLKYNPRNAFLVGLNPSEPERFDNVLLFGDCAIKSTQNSNFREIKIDVKKASQNKKKSKKKKEKFKVKRNKKILEFPGCPPEINNCLELIHKYYGRTNLPNLTFLKIMMDSKEKETLKSMGVK